MLKPEGYPATPLLDRAIADRDENQTIGEFIEWLQGQHVHLCVWRPAGNNDKPRQLPGFEEAREKALSASYGGITWLELKVLEAEFDNPEFEEWGEGFVPWDEGSRGIEALLAHYRGIDLAEMERERAAVLAALRSRA